MKKKNILPLFLLLFLVSNGFAFKMAEKIKLKAKIVVVETRLEYAKTQCKEYTKQLRLKDAAHACAKTVELGAELLQLKAKLAALK